MAEQALEDGRCDIISVTRAMLADPFWLRKTERGETQSIRRCIACTRCINDREHGGLICSVNPFERREEELEIRPTDKPKDILVIGAGPAGLQAAAVASQRGHHVTVVEKESMPGGMVAQAGVRYTAYPKRRELIPDDSGIRACRKGLGGTKSRRDWRRLDWV